jgi:hypothetical protein
MMENPTLGRLSSALTHDGARGVLAMIFQEVTDEGIADSYQRTDGAPGNPFADLLCAEAERRGVDL